MSYFTECVVRQITGIGKASNKTLIVDPVSNLSVKVGNEQYLVWREDGGAVPPKLVASRYELSTSLDDVVLVQLKDKRIRLHSDDPSTLLVSSIDLI